MIAADTGRIRQKLPTLINKSEGTRGRTVNARNGYLDMPDHPGDSNWAGMINYVMLRPSA